MMYSRAFILHHYFASKSFPAVRDVFNDACPDNAVPNKTIINRLATNLRDTGTFFTWKVLIERQNS
jgi:hypothetical protein